MCSFALVRKIWGGLATSHAPITAYGHLENKSYILLVLLANLADLLRPVDSISIILVVFDIFSSSRDGIPLVMLVDC